MHNVILIHAFINFNVQRFFGSTYIIISFTQLKRFTEVATKGHFGKKSS